MFDPFRTRSLVSGENEEGSMVGGKKRFSIEKLGFMFGICGKRRLDLGTKVERERT